MLSISITAALHTCQDLETFSFDPFLLFSSESRHGYKVLDVFKRQPEMIKRFQTVSIGTHVQ